jgi:hypothetical protein
MEVLKHPHHHAAVDSCNGLVPAEAAAVPADMEHRPVRETQEFVCIGPPQGNLSLILCMWRLSLSVFILIMSSRALNAAGGRMNASKKQFVA